MTFSDIRQHVRARWEEARGDLALLPYVLQQVGMLACDEKALRFYFDPALDWALLDTLLAQTAMLFAAEIAAVRAEIEHRLGEGVDVPTLNRGLRVELLGLPGA